MTLATPAGESQRTGEVAQPERRPAWLRAPWPGGDNYIRLKHLLRDQQLHTVCEEAHCPNIGECFQAGTATFIILGNVCTRACRYCAVTSGKPGGIVDEDEPERVAASVARLGLRHAVVTSVNRDDLPDGGARIFAATIRAIRRHVPGCSVEVLIPDFQANRDSLQIVIDARPDILNHNVETVPRLYPKVRPRGRYEWALTVLKNAREMMPAGRTKSGLMVGLGESEDEVRVVMTDLVAVGCNILTLGQYLRPTPHHWPIARYYTPDDFARLRETGLRLGFQHVEAGPLVRSSYHAGQQVERWEQRD